MQQEPLDGKPATTKPSDQALLNAYYQEPIKQAERFADLAKELFKVELAIPGIYAAVLRLSGMEQSTNHSAVWAAFVFWTAALILTLRTIFSAQVRGAGECCVFEPTNTPPRTIQHRGVFSEEYAG
ncbi:hypothetical protein E4P82_10110 [Candidatus Competibacter phosphatis]|uniref:Uncharacterized protein n=1 Tax=Candidatus Competibacter phosphatis TaxID=221280 RepID=A0ABX1TLD3_9GAMM|nr:hypothetical protein [Candidatus Competibacter phosphatis]NMQ19516.1 hypothetical protein [Candidatus Competibacter phosphatis]